MAAVQLFAPLVAGAAAAQPLKLATTPALCVDFVCDQTPCFAPGQYGPAAVLAPCSASSATLRLFANGTVVVVSGGVLNASTYTPGFCLDMRGGDESSSHGVVQAYPCVGSPNQEWDFRRPSATDDSGADGSSSAIASDDCGPQDAACRLVVRAGPVAQTCATGCALPFSSSFCPSYHPIRDANVYDPSGPLLVSGGWVGQSIVCVAAARK